MNLGFVCTSLTVTTQKLQTCSSWTLCFTLKAVFVLKIFFFFFFGHVGKRADIKKAKVNFKI